MKKGSFSVVTKIWCFLCVLIAVSLGKSVVLSCMLTITACLHLAVQGKGNIVFNYGIFYILLGLVRDTIPRPSYVDFLGILCVDVLEAVSCYFTIVGFNYNASRKDFLFPEQKPYPDTCHSGCTCSIQVFPHYEIGIEECVSVNEKQKSDRYQAGAESFRKKL
mgnify:CR=1 FL=1